MRRILIPLFAGLSLLTPPAAFAQAIPQDPAQGAIGTAQPDPAGLAPPVVTGSVKDAHVDATRLALAQQVFAVAGRPALMADVRGLTAGLGVQLASAMAERDAPHARAMVEAVGEGLSHILPQLEAEAVSRLTRDFTADQLKEMLAFYQTPTGALAARRLPLIARQAVGAAPTYLPQMMAAVKDGYCDRVACTRAEKRAFDEVAQRIAAAHPGDAPPTDAEPPAGK